MFGRINYSAHHTCTCTFCTYNNSHVHVVHGHYVCSLGSRPSPLHHSIASVNCAPLQGRGTLSKWGKVSKVIRQCRCVYSTCLAGLFCTSYMYMHILCTHVHVHGHYVCSLGSRPSPLHHSIASVNCAPLQGRGTLSKWGKVSKVIRQCRCVYSTCLAGLFCTSYMYMHILCTHVHVHGHYVCSLGSRPSPLHHSIASVNCVSLQGRGTSPFTRHPHTINAQDIMDMGKTWNRG